MESLTQYLFSLPGVDEELLVRLALANPTVLQLQLLVSASAVRSFLGDDVLATLDDNTLAQLAVLDPTPSQLRLLLRSAGAVRTYIRIRRGSWGVGLGLGLPMPAADANPVSQLHDRIMPLVASYEFQYREDHHDYHCRCRLEPDRETEAIGPSKRAVKQSAAQAMLERLSDTPSHR